MSILEFLEEKKDQLKEIAENVKENVIDKMSNIETNNYFDDDDEDDDDLIEEKEDFKRKFVDKNLPLRYSNYEIMRIKDIMEVDTFWKFTQSEPGFSKEPFFAEYKQGRVTETGEDDEWLTFYGSRDIGKCVGFGDQLTRISFNKNDKDVRKMMNNTVVFMDNEFNEMRTKELKVERQFSLSNPETIAKIIDMSSIASLRVFFKNTFCNIFDMLEAYQFNESLDFVKQLLEKYDLKTEENVKKLKRNVYFELDRWKNKGSLEEIENDDIEEIENMDVFDEVKEIKKVEDKKTKEIELGDLEEAIIRETVNSASNTLIK